MSGKGVLWAAAIFVALNWSVLGTPTNTPDFQIELPGEWEMTDNGETYPFAITHATGNAELLVFRSDLEPHQSIGSADDLKLSVQKVIDSVILSLPNSKLISNTGFSETARTGFALEFVSADAESGAILRHRMMGWLYRHSDGHQILFTLWGKGLFQNYQQFERDIHLMQAGFDYTGPRTAIALSSGARDWALPAIVILMAIAGLLYFRSAKNSRHSRSAFHESGWVCGCGVRNSAAVQQCRTCGLTRPMARVR